MKKIITNGKVIGWLTCICLFAGCMLSFSAMAKQSMTALAAGALFLLAGMAGAWYFYKLHS